MHRREGLELNSADPLVRNQQTSAKQADGAVLVRMGDSVVLVTACSAPSAREGIDFLPLDRRLQGIHLRVGQDSREVLQARGESRPRRRC